LKTFLDVFNFHVKNKNAERKKIWNSWDVNGNGLISLAEVDKSIQDLIISKTGNNKVYKFFKPAYIRAFNDAKDACPSTDSNSDEYVSKSEFRILIVYLRVYCTMYQIFSYIDGATNASGELNDRKISRDEWIKSVDSMKEISNSWAGFVKLKTASEEDFDKMDSDG